MPNVFKFNTSIDEKSLRKGNFSIGTGDVSKGPTTLTGFYNGITPPQGGWTIYHRRGETNNFGIYTASTLNLVSLTNQLDGKTFTQVWQCLNHFAGTSSRVVLNKDFAPMVTDGLVLMIDASNTISNPTTASICYDLGSGQNNAVLINGAYFLDNSIDLDGSNDYISITYSGNTINSYTFIITIKCDNMTGDTALNRQTIFGLSQNTNGAFRQFDLEIWGDAGQGFRGDGGSVEGTNFSGYGWPTSRTTNLINFYAVTLTSTGHKVYMNGQLRNTISSTRTAPFNSIVLGTRIVGNQWNGQCFNFSTYTRELSLSEILQNYYGASIVTDGLVYALDPGNLVSYDTSGLTAYSLIGNFTASLVNGTTYSKNFGGVFDFAGQDEFIELPYDPYWNSNVFGTSTNFTLECWYKPDVFENWDTIIEKAQTPGFYSASEGPAIWSYGSQNPSNPGFVAVFSSGTQSNPGGSIVQIFYNTTTLKWYHLCFTGDGTTLRFYVDGVQRGTALVSSRTIPVTNGNAGPRFGRRQYIDGQLASARFYTRHLTPSEVSNNYGATKWRFGL
jgi:hypothetical protein